MYLHLMGNVLVNSKTDKNTWRELFMNVYHSAELIPEWRDGLNIQEVLVSWKKSIL